MNPVTQNPVTQNPVTQNPVTQNPVTQNPVTQNPVTQNPVTQNPVTQNPVTQKPVTRQDVEFIWDDTDVLLQSYPDIELDSFVRHQLEREIQWIKKPLDKIQIMTGTESIGQLPYNLPYRKLLFHNSKYIVGLASKYDPSTTASAPSKADPIQADKLPTWPEAPSTDTLYDWQVHGHRELIASSPSKISGPQLFHVFDTIINEDGFDTPTYEPANHPNTKKILDWLDSDHKMNKLPLFKSGRFFVGRFKTNTSNQIDWDVTLLHKLPYHAQCAGVTEPGLEYVMMAVYNRTIQLWDLSNPQLGPMATLDLPNEVCSTKAIIDMVITMSHIAILDGFHQLTIIPWSLKTFQTIHKEILTIDYPHRTQFVPDRFITQKKLAPVFMDKGMTCLKTPTAFALGTNTSYPDVCYIGTQNGFVHELHMKIDEEKMEIWHTYTYYTRRYAPVQFLTGRGERLVCGNTHEIFIFNHSTDKQDNYLSMETGSGHALGIRNVLFCGNLVLFETNNRHLNLINSVFHTQRILPTSLGSSISSDAKDSAYKERMRESSYSIIMWDNFNAVIRIAYKNLTTESWTLNLSLSK